MSDYILTYTLNLQDKISDKLKTITIVNEQQWRTWADVQKKIVVFNLSKIHNLKRFTTLITTTTTSPMLYSICQRYII